MVALAFGLMGSMAGGALIGGALGSQIGWMLGQMIGNALFPPPAQEGPRLSDLKMTTSAYGQAIPLVYAAARISGNVIWSTDKEEHKHSESQGKGGGQEVNTYSDSISTAVLLCQGPILGIRKIWANSNLVFDAGAGSAAAIVASSKLSGSIRVYLGDESQLPDPYMQGHDGIEATPAYRGTAYVMFQDLDLTDFGNSFPNLEFEVVSAGSDIGPRLLNGGPYKFDQVGGRAGPTYLYNVVTVADFADGLDVGYPIVAGLKAGSIDIVATGHRTDTGSISALNAWNTRWTVDEHGNFLASGTRMEDYSGLLSNQIQEQVGVPGKDYGFEQKWIGSVGSGQLFVNRAAPVQIPSNQTVNDGHVYPSGWSPFFYNGKGTVDRDIYSGTPYIVGSSSGKTFINGAYTSANGKMVVVITGETLNDGALAQTHWHLFDITADGATKRSSGEIDQTSYGDLPHGWGRQKGNYRGRSGMLEEDGTHLWIYNGYASCYEIGGDNVMRQICHITVPVDDYYSVYAVSGVAVMAGSQGLYTFTRTTSLNKSQVTLASIVSDICVRAGLSTGDIDVSQLTDDMVDGVVYGQQMTWRSMLEVLRNTYFFDAVETDDKLVFVKRGQTPIATIPEDDLAAKDGMSLDPPGDQLKITRQQELELPRMVTVDYFAIDADFQDGSQYDASQHSKSLNTMKLQLPVAMSDNKAKSVAMTTLWMLQTNRDMFEFSTNRKYSHVNPTDVAIVNKGNLAFTVRIVKRTDGGDGIINFIGIKEHFSVYTQVSVGGVVSPGQQTLSLPGPTELAVLDMPALVDAYGTSPSVFLAGNGYSKKWKQADIYESSDSGSTYTNTGITLTAPTIIGNAFNALPVPAKYGVFDEANYLDIHLSNSEASLSSDTEENVLAGSNWAYLGGEVIAYKNATQIGTSFYRLTGLLRGLKGTEDKADHTAGTKFVKLSKSSMRMQSLASGLMFKTLEYKAVTNGSSLSDSHDVSIDFVARNMSPYSPVYFSATNSSVDGSGDWNFNIIHRPRLNNEWLNFTDTAGMETGETFEFEIWSMHSEYSGDDHPVRTLTGTTYSLANQSTDFGSGRKSLYVKAYQVLPGYGRGPGTALMHFLWSPVMLSPSYDALIPVMTSLSGTAGTVLESSEYSGSSGWHALDNGSTNGWLDDSTMPSYVGFEFATAKTVIQYAITPWSVDSFPTRSPKTWSLQASQDGTHWATIDTRTNFTAWVINQPTLFTTTNAEAYLYYRINVASNEAGTGFVGIKKFQYYGFDGGTLGVVSSALANLVPVMTSNTTPSGVCSASSSYSSTPPWNGFDTSSNGWLNNATSMPNYLQYQFPTAQVIQSYAFNPWDVDNFPARCPQDFSLQASNDGSSWTTLDTQSGITSWAVGTTKTFPFTNSTAYTYYRLNITSNNGDGYTGLRKLQLLG